MRNGRFRYVSIYPQIDADLGVQSVFRSKFLPAEAHATAGHLGATHADPNHC